VDVFTHAIWPDLPPGPLVRTCCGLLIRRTAAVHEPSCLDCQAALARFEAFAIDEDDPP
jgi:hypothetical protein